MGVLDTLDVVDILDKQSDVQGNISILLQPRI